MRPSLDWQEDQAAPAASAQEAQPTQGNPVLAVADSAIQNGDEERARLIAALKESGSARGAWVGAARDRISDVEDFVADKQAHVKLLGCWAAGCAIDVSFEGAQPNVRLESLADPAGHGAWTSGVIITEPTIDPTNGVLSSTVYFLAPDEE
ncbi:MAG: hypothetical protein H6708_22470 [Kofleriaceae bacterium]|nr:hypothetical protein [Myxococcales bacterium]MCB9563171.1 hypothetical protein [Kofleriaceae bacterium]